MTTVSNEYTGYSTLIGTTRGSTKGASNTHTAFCDGANDAADRWYRFTAPDNGYCLITAVDAETNYPALLSWRPACELSDYGCNYSVASNGTSTLIGVGNLYKGRTYYVSVEGQGATQGDFQLRIKCVAGICGDGFCSTSATAENCQSCPTDCGTCPEICGDGICYGSENCSNCGVDCGVCLACGNGACDGAENCASCTSDCGACPPSCGDYACNGAETCDTCPGDCGGCYCGDGKCNGSEACESCPSDCGACPYCGDGTCSGAETCRNCRADCGSCPVVCGDSVCDPSESCSSCSVDCGTCDGSCLKPYELGASSVTGSTAAASGTRAATCVSPDGNDRTYRFVAPVTGACTASTDNDMTQFDTVLEVGTDCTSAAQLCNNDVPGSATGSLKSRLDFSVVRDQAYLVTVDGRSGSKGNFQLDIGCVEGSSCGNGNCDNAETCSSCASDCGACGGNCGGI